MRTIRAPRCNQLTCKSWLTEAPMRMLMNNLDPEVAENPQELVVYGGSGKAARNWECFDAIVKSLQHLENDETLLVQSGKPVAVFKSHPDAPRVIIANSNIVPHWATWENFREYEKMGLTMYGQMTAGSWIYIGTQGILQGTYETFAECGRKHFNGTLRGTITLTAGLGGMGGAQPLAVTMNDGVALCVEVDPYRIQRRLETKYCDVMVKDLSEAWKLAQQFKIKGEGKSIALLGNAADILPDMLNRGMNPDIVTDQTSAHDALHGYVPSGLKVEELSEWRKNKPDEYIRRSMESMAAHVRAMLDFQNPRAGSETGRRQRIRLSRICTGVYSSVILRRAGAFSLGGIVRRPGRYLRDRSSAYECVSRKGGFAALARTGKGKDSISRAALPDLLVRVWRT